MELKRKEVLSIKSDFYTPVCLDFQFDYSGVILCFLSDKGIKVSFCL